MKRFFNWHKKRKSIVGISESDYISVYNELTRKINAAEESGSASYAQGLIDARNVLDSIKPYRLSEV